MSQETKAGGAEGGGNPVELGLKHTDDEFEDLRSRMERLNKQDRRRTIQRLSRMFVEEEAGKTSTPLLRDQNVDNGVPVAQNVGATQITVEQSEKKLPRFSGAAKFSQGEVNYRKWQRAATRLVEENITEQQKKKSILRSLQGEADDIADLHRQKTAAEILDVLDKQYGGMIEGDDLLVEFYQNYQREKQSTSEYVSVLFVELGEVVKFGGLQVDDMPKALLKQLIRGTHDEDMLNKLRFEEKVENPPNFPDLISSIRREESRRTERRLRHKRQARAQATVAQPEAVTKPVDAEVTHLRQRLAELETAAVQWKAEPEPQPQSEVIRLQQRVVDLEDKFKVRSRNIFCYRCGEDAHMATECGNPPNKKLVQEKVDARKRRRQQQLN